VDLPSTLPIEVEWRPRGEPPADGARRVACDGAAGVRVTDGAASSAYAARVGYAEVASGLSDLVLVLGVQKALDVYEPRTGHRPDAALTLESWTLDVTWELPYTVMPWGLVLTAHMAKYGTTEEQMAAVAVKNHKHGTKNPKAQFQKEITVEQVLKSAYVADPIKLYDCCPFTDGGAAVVLASEEVALRTVFDEELPSYDPYDQVVPSWEKPTAAVPA
jgi:acetyl-CoA acetyltransferase